MAAVSGRALALTGDGSAERVPAEIVTEGYFDLLGAAPERGRVFETIEHQEPDAHPVAVISHALWERRFGLAPDALGATILLEERPLTVVGIMPAGFGGTSLDVDVWVPESMISLIASPDLLESRGSRFLTVVGRLAPGATLEGAQAELDAIATDLQASFPRAHEDRFAQVVAFREGYLGGTGRLLWILMGAGLLLLLIAAANVANLLLVRSHGRTRELVLRRALGAEAGRIAGQLLAESAVLAAIGGLAGMGVATLALEVLGPMIPAGVLPGYAEPAFSTRAFVFSLVVLALVGIGTGLVPAFSSARVDIATRLRDGKGSVGGSPGRLRAQHAFVVAQVGLALVLMVGAGLLTRSFRAQLSVDTGAELDGVVAMRTQTPNGRYDSSETIMTFARELERRLRALPGAASVSLSSDLPFRGGSSGIYMLREGDGPEDRIRVHRHSVTPAYFETLGIGVAEGRGFTEDDVDGAPGVVVITAAMAARVYPGESAVGRTMMLRPDGSWNVRIVGVVEDVRFRDVTTSLMADANSPDVFFPFWQLPSRGLEVAVRAEEVGPDATALLSSMRETLSDIDPDLPAYELGSLREAWRDQTATPRFAAWLMSIFSLLATGLACVGVYGVLAFAVGQRAQEIAIRRAIGATGAKVARSVVGDGLRLAAIGLGVGAVAAAAGSRVLEGFLFGVEATDPLTFVSVGAGMVAVAALAAIVPALRAMRRDPAEALGAE
jgi:putative ABC transport system permease protein